MKAEWFSDELQLTDTKKPTHEIIKHQLNTTFLKTGVKWCWWIACQRLHSSPQGEYWRLLLGAPGPMTQGAVVAPTPHRSGCCPWLAGGAPWASSSSRWSVTVPWAWAGGIGSNRLQSAKAVPAPRYRPALPMLRPSHVGLQSKRYTEVLNTHLRKLITNLWNSEVHSFHRHSPLAMFGDQNYVINYRTAS